MSPDLSDQEIVALLAELDRIIDADRFPLSPRIQILTGIRDKLRSPPVREPLPPPKVYEPPGAAPTPMRTDPGPPMKLGNTAANHAHIIVWCKACQHQIEPDPAAMAARYGGRDVGARLARAARMLLVRQPGYRDMVLTSTRR